MIAWLKHKPLFALASFAVLAVALWLRLHDLTGASLWLDEAYSAFGAEKDFNFIGTILPTYDAHPPFYTALLRCWTLLFGTSILSFRAFGACTGMLTLWFVWLGGREVGKALGRDPAMAALAAFAAATVLHSLVYWTRIVRPYALIMLVFAAGLWAVLRIARDIRETGAIRNAPWLVYCICQALLFWLHNLGALNVASLGLGLLILCGPMIFWQRFRLRFILSHALLALVALPAFLILADQAPTWVKSTWLAFQPDKVAETLLIVYGVPGLAGAGFAAVLIAMAFRLDRRLPAALLVMALFPTVASLLLSAAVTPVFLPRTLIAVNIPFAVLLGLGVVSAGRIGFIVYALFVLLAAKLSFEVKQTRHPEDWYGAAEWLKARVRPGDQIYTYPNEAALPLHYAMRERALVVPVRPIPDAMPSRDTSGWHPTGSRATVSLPQYRLDQIAGDAQSRAVPTIWLVRSSPERYDKGDGFVKSLLRDRRAVGTWPGRKLNETASEPIDIIGLTRAR